jgi:hypothetical protein
MQPILIQMTKSRIPTALAALFLQTSYAYSASTVIVHNPNLTQPAPWVSLPPGEYVKLVSTDPSFSVQSASPSIYAGLLYGTVAGTAAAFFCAELNKAVTFGGAGISYDVNALATLPTSLTDGDTTSPIALSSSQLCLLSGVFAQLGIGDRNAYTTGGAQDLVGTTTEANELEAVDISNARAAAAQLVIWEIIHEPNSVFLSPTVPNISLTSGSLLWYKDAGLTPLTGAIVTEFNSLAAGAYAHCNITPVPEIASPVALLAGGLLFVRRRERRGSRLKTSSDSSNTGVAVSA